MVIVVVIVIVMIVAVVLAIPAMVVGNYTVRAFPAAFKKSFAIVTRANPHRTRIRRPGPISCVPHVASIDWVPVSIDPYVVGSGAYRPHGNNPRRRWRSDSDTN